jgi:membrane protease YdiL (CAAX protease family)
LNTKNENIAKSPTPAPAPRPKDAAAIFFYAVAASLVAQVLITLALRAYAGGDGALTLLETNFTANILVGVALQAAMLAAVYLWARARRLKVLPAVRAVPLKPRGIGYAVLMGLAALFGFMYVSFAADYLFNLIGYDGNTAEALSFTTWGRLITGMFTVALLPAVVEETVFRGFVLRGLSRAGKRRAVVLSAAAFCLMHMNPAQTAHQFLLGLALGTAAIETGSLLAPMIMHFLNNALVLILDFTGADVSFGIEGAQIFWFAGVTFLLGTGIIIGLAALYRKAERKTRDADGKTKGKGGDSQSPIPDFPPLKEPFGKLMVEERNTVLYGAAAFAAAAAVWVIVLADGLF